MKYTYTPRGICATKFEFDIDKDIIKSLKITNGCPGNTLGVSKLIANKNIDDVIKLFSGIDCRNRGTSCPDQIAQALKQYKKNND
jgi:uncharacterized protein (TIGR03905 family)